MGEIRNRIRKGTHPLPPLKRGWGYYWTLLFVGITGVLVVATPFASGSGLVNGLVMGGVFWLHLAMGLFALVMMGVVCFGKGRHFSFSIPDAGILLFLGITLATYNWELNPEPEKLWLGGQLVILWFFLRYVFSEYPVLQPYFIFLLMLTGLVEAVWGMEQLHGVRYSNHSLFRLTGSFFNPGPYSGYLAVILPLCLSTAFRFRLGMQYVAWGCVVAILVVLPAGMSRSAWIAGAIACGWVYWMHRMGWQKTKEVVVKYRKAVVPILIIGILAGGIALAGLYRMKQDSANGRLLMWKVTGKAMLEQPFSGTGLGGFPDAFAEAQGGYFRTGEATDTEKMVAGSPEYAFNEFLQIGTEQGVMGLLAFLGWIGGACLIGIKERKIGAVGGLIALMVFAFSSYPLQLPVFWVVMVVLGAVATTTIIEDKDDTPPFPSREGKGYPRIVKLGMIGLGIGSLVLLFGQKEQYGAYKQWNRMQMLYNNKAYQTVEEEYTELHSQLKHKPEFLFEEAQCLNKVGKQEEAVSVLERAKLLSADPMIRYMLAKNEQELGNYRKAETELLQAIDILPERIYPYYLLAKFYALPEVDQKDHFQEVAHIVLTKEPKVKSTAIREMREEIKKLLEKK